jgi:HAD superfamily hydrolase (TIGR01484 family)
MLPLSLCPPARLAAVRGLLTDIDDTLTDGGRIAPEALQALHQLRAAGIPVIAITGRPAGWSKPMALAWPVDAIVAENGAVMLRLIDGALQFDFTEDAATRAANFIRLQTCAADVIARVPGATLATDSPGRLTDIAIDHSEFAQLSAEQIAAVCAVMRAHGLHATVSSIHINGWIGGHSKWTAACWAIGPAFDPAEWIYVGDSTNDALMFERMPLSVGVANIARFVPQLTALPTYVTEAERGAGFAELARALLSARQA